MAETVQASLDLMLKATQTNIVGLATATANPKLQTPLVWVAGDGTNANEVNGAYSASGSIAPSGAASINLTSLAEVFGTTNLTKVKGFLFYLPAGTTQSRSLTLGGAAAAAWDSAFSGTVTMKPGGVFFIGCVGDTGAYTTASKTNVKLTNGDTANGASYSVFVVGIQ